MSIKFDILREKVNKISLTDPSSMIETLLSIVDKLEQIYIEIRQGYTEIE